MITRQNIEDNVHNWVNNFIGQNFTFRQYQFEKICDILENILITKENHVHIVEAPTGSGKSLIIMISAGVLAKYYGLTSYILCSDLFLFGQYETFIKAHPLMNFGMIKGQTGNYCCTINGEDMKNADCRLAQIAWSALFNEEKAEELGYPCAKECEYVQARKKAVKADVCLMTYQLFLFSMYLANKSHNSSYFKKKDVIFCDECHNVPSIIRSKFAPTFSLKEIDKLMDIYHESDLRSHDLFEEDGYEIQNLYKEDEFHKKLLDIFDKFIDDTTSKKEDYDTVLELQSILTELEPTLTTLENTIGEAKRKGTTNPGDLRTFKTISHIRNQMCYWNDLMRCIGDLEDGYKYLLKIGEDKNGEKKVNFSCTKEDWMVYKYLLCEAGWKIMLSATVGGKSAYEENIGARFTDEQETKFEMIPSTFDFTKSPVYFLNRYKMSFKEKDASFENLKPILFNIINQNKGKRGIIQTGSYDFAQKLMFYAPPEIQSRFIMYNGSKEKQIAVEEHRIREDGILVGPTLVEGVDLPDDLCRFIVILKVPYPNLKDRYVAEKIKMFPMWYNSTTSNAIIQGIGRGVRNENDYCVTYIMDACFYSLYISTKEQYAPELQKRIFIYK